MIYDFRLTIPANTAQADILEQEARLSFGVIHRVEIEFPAGCAGLVHVRILRGNHQVWPTNLDGSFRSDDHVIAFDTDYDLTDEPTDLLLVGWNLDDSYPHTITFRLGVKAVPVTAGGWEETPVGQAVLAILEEA